MLSREDEAQKNQDAGDDDVSDPQERVTPSDPRHRRQDDALGTVEHGNRVVVLDVDAIEARSHHVVVVALVQLAERRETCCAHPDHEMLVLARVEEVGAIAEVGAARDLRPAPIGRWDQSTGIHLSTGVLVLLSWPDDVVLRHDVGGVLVGCTGQKHRI